MISWKDPMVYTNFLFYLNAALYGLFGYPILMVLFVLSATFSLQYHRFPLSKIWSNLDMAFAVTALSGVLVTSFVSLSLLNFAILVSVALCTLVVKRYGDLQTDKVYYRQCHTFWHLAVFAGNVLAAVILHRF